LAGLPFSAGLFEDRAGLQRCVAKTQRIALQGRNSTSLSLIPVCREMLGEPRGCLRLLGDM
jgi:hypothetical protein